MTPRIFGIPKFDFERRHMNEEEKRKRKYFRMRRFAARLVRELRKFSGRCADNAERTLRLMSGGR